MNKFPHLFSPMKLGPYTLRNRIEAAPAGVSDLTPEGYLTPANTALYENRARGGAAIVTIGESLVDSVSGKAHGRIIPLHTDEILPTLIDTTDAIKNHGAIASIELLHAGRRSHPKMNPGGKVYGPSAGESIYGGPILEMDEAMIEHVVEAFGDAAEMAKLGGTQMCQIHGGHGWLLAQFLSPVNNQRKDRFGGSLENRARISLMVIENIRAKCGANYPIEFRLSGDEFIEGGFSLDEAVAFAQMIDGKVDLIHVSATTFHNPDAVQRMIPNMFHSRGCNVFLAEAIKQAVKTPVVTLGALNDPAHMEEILATGQADMIALGRALVADPFLPEKARKGREDDITYCLRCNLCVSGSFVPYVKYATRVSRCMVNPTYGREFDSRFVQASAGSKKVMVAGGGPAGLSAAITAADRGHSVILCEKTDSLGGMLNYATHPDFKVDLARLKDVLVRRVAERPIEVRLNTEVTPDLVNEIHPDALIAAVGAEPIMPSIPGIDRPNVFNAVLLPEESELGQKIVIIGGGLVGCEEGVHLAQHGKDVTVLEMLEAAATDAHYLHWRALMIEMGKLVHLHTNTRAIAITAEGVQAVDADGVEHLFEADSVLVAVGLKARSSVVENLRDCVTDFSIIGDCFKPARVLEAVHMGYFTALNI